MSDSGHTLVTLLDNAGDVLLSGPAVRAAAAGSHRVTYLCGPAGAAAAALLPGVDSVIVWEAPWVGFSPPEVCSEDLDCLVRRLNGLGIDRAAILGSNHQSPLPLALLLRLAGIRRIATISDESPGSLLDHRLSRQDGRHEVEHNLTVLAALGLHPAGDDDDRLRISVPAEQQAPCVGPLAASGAPLGGRFDAGVVVAASASVAARGLPADRVDAIINRLLADGWPVTVTGVAVDTHPSPRAGLTDLIGQTDLTELAQVLSGAAVVVGGNSATVHLAAAVQTPVVSVFAPVVSWTRWRPWRVPTVRLGLQDAPCAGCRAHVCPRLGQPCLSDVTPDAVARAVGGLAGFSLFSRSRGPGYPEGWR